MLSYFIGVKKNLQGTNALAYLAPLLATKEKIFIKVKA
jgi:hypothetical protein